MLRVLVVVALLLGVPRLLGDGDDENDGAPNPRDHGGSVHIYAGAKDCWTLRMLPRWLVEQQYAWMRPNEAKAAGLDVDAASDLDAREAKGPDNRAHVTKGCGPAVIALPADQYAGGLVLGYDHNDRDRHWLPLVAAWLTTKRILRGAVVVPQDGAGKRVLYGWAPGVTFLHDDGDVRKIRGYFASGSSRPSRIRATSTRREFRALQQQAAHAAAAAQKAFAKSAGDGGKTRNAARGLAAVSHATDAVLLARRALRPSGYGLRAWTETLTALERGPYGPHAVRLAHLRREEEYTKVLRQQQAAINSSLADFHDVEPVPGLEWMDHYVYADYANGFRTTIPKLRLIAPYRAEEIDRLEAQWRGSWASHHEAYQQGEAQMEADLANSSCIDGDGDGVCHES